jgi:hypothetical protein
MKMIMNGFEVRLWKLVIACFKVYCQYSYKMRNAPGNLNSGTQPRFALGAY